MIRYVEETVAEADDATAWIKPRGNYLGITVNGSGTFDVDLQTRFAGGSAIDMYDASGQMQYSDAPISTVVQVSGDPGQEYRLTCSAYTSGTPYMRLGWG